MKEKLKKIRKILRKGYSLNNHYNKDKIFDEILFIFFSWRTPIRKAEEIYQSLKTLYSDWNCFFYLTEDKWFGILESGGKATDKAKTIVKLLKKLKDDFDTIQNIETILLKSDIEIYEYLISLPGIKDKSAYCIMLYAMQKAVFPADAHCLRICQRIGIIKGKNQNKQDRIRGQRELNEMLKGDYQFCYDLHTTMIQHGKEVCKAKNPKCKQCIISDMCACFKEGNS